MASDVPVVFAHWERFVGWLLPRTQKLPRRMRFTFTSRIDNLALDIYELLVEARYTRARAPILRRVNLSLEKLRLLLRLVHDLGELDRRSFAHAIREIDTVGRMVGGWIRHFARGAPWALRVDFASYFASVPHDPLVALVRRRVPDHALCALLERIVRAPGHAPQPDRGLPIGALTSQHLANLYLGQVDHWFKDDRGHRRYLRYMDDLVAFGDPGALRSLLAELRVLVAGLGLDINERHTRMLPVRDGVPFLGFRIYPSVVRARPATARRFRRGCSEAYERFACGVTSESALAASLGSRCAQLAHADTWSFRRVTFRRFAEGGGTGHERPEPRHPRRLVQRRSAQHAGRQPQPRRPVEAQRQPRVSRGELSAVEAWRPGLHAGRPESGHPRIAALRPGADPAGLPRSTPRLRRGTETPLPGSGPRSPGVAAGPLVDREANE